ncbi:transcriptional regulator [Geomonas silvestris]|uniref:Transcriptional regulator n=1 Tax=Geomonas silvestris TaxID=2740184 RepID=A0A6V8MMI7_9BACT|nr:MarR family transcriptional regulator [Geomonas silvestris]GFO61228.1 transcriptional regulator [Geomonas silvestris]
MPITDHDIDRSNLLFLLGRLTRRWRQVLDSEFQISGITDATWRPLLHLERMGEGVRQKDLASSLGIEGPSLVRLLDTLVAKGLVERREDPADRRAKNLTLTDAGALLVRRILTVLLPLEEELLGSFSDAEIAQMAGLVKRLEGSLDTLKARGKR